MKPWLWIVSAALASLGATAQSAPNFSGTWTMDLARSEAAAQGTPIGPVTVTIRQTADEIVIETTRNGIAQPVRYLPAGTRGVLAGELVGTFRWEGSKLFTTLETDINKQAVTVTELRSLNAAATEMTVEVTFVVQHGYEFKGAGGVPSQNRPNASTGKNVFVKTR